MGILGIWGECAVMFAVILKKLPQTKGNTVGDIERGLVN